MTRSLSCFLVLLGLLSLVGCSDEPPASENVPQDWAWVAHSQAAALLGVHGTSENDVWLSGADDGRGPVVLHWNGRDWSRAETGVRADLWWVHATSGGPVFFGGSDATVLRYEQGKFERLTTPGLGKYTIYGISSAA